MKKTLLLVVAFTVMLSSCLSFQKSASVVHKGSGSGHNPSESGEGMIKVAVYEYLVRNELYRATNAVFFVELGEDDMSTLRSKLSEYRFKLEKEAERMRGVGVRDKSTKSPGVILRCGKVQFENNSARLFAGYRSSTVVVHEFVLSRDEGWHIIDVSGPGILDLR